MRSVDRGMSVPNKLCTRCEGCKEGGRAGGSEERGRRERGRGIEGERERGGRVRICNRHEDICKAYYVILGMRDCTCHRLP